MRMKTMLGFFGCCVATGRLAVDIMATSDTNEPSQILLLTSMFQLPLLATCVRSARSSIDHHGSMARWRLAAAPELTCYACFHGEDPSGSLTFDLEVAKRLAFEPILDLTPGFVGHR